MVFHWKYSLILLVVTWVSRSLASTNQWASKPTGINACISKQTCSDCIQTPSCSWCAVPVSYIKNFI